MKKKFIFAILTITLTLCLAIAACNNEITGGPITNVALSVPVPVTGAIPATAAEISYSGNFTVTHVSWSPDHSRFQGGYTYSIHVRLNANVGYTFYGINGDSIAINGNNTFITLNPMDTVSVLFYFPETR